MSTSRLRLAAAAALAVAAAVAIALLVSGGASGDAQQLGWDGKPKLFKSGKPTDRVLYGRFENTSRETLDLDTDRARLLDAEGNEVRSTVVFLEAFAHSLFAWSQRPQKLTEFERRRLGQLATLKPGQDLPITVSWRVPAGEKPPVKVDFGTSELKLPA